MFSLSLPMMLMLFFFVFLAGFVDSAAGGGGLISLPAYLATGMPVHSVYGCNKLSSACGTTLASIRFFKNKALEIKVALVAALSSFIGSGIAARIVLLMDDVFLKKMVMFVLPIAAVIVFLNKKTGEKNQSYLLTPGKKIGCAVIIGAAIGFYDGLIGPGTGTFAIIAFSMIMKYDLRTASGNAKFLNLASNYASLITYAASGNVIWHIAVPAAACNVLGSYLGSGLALKKGAVFIRPMILIVMVLLMLKVGADLFLG